jgi:hypothetical protein
MSGAGDSAGMLLVQMEPPATLEDEFHAWYDSEHVPERDALPGFNSAVRFVCTQGWPRYMACYDLTSLAVLEGDEYRRIGGPNLSIWSKRVLARVIGYERLELSLAQGEPATRPGNGKAMVRIASDDLDAVARAAGRLGDSAPQASVRVWENAVPAGETTIMLDAPAAALIPDWPAAALAEAVGDLAGSLVGVWRYTRYRRWT